jgi:hypothetical protein
MARVLRLADDGRSCALPELDVDGGSDAVGA